jgi:hypothetical protein
MERGEQREHMERADFYREARHDLPGPVHDVKVLECSPAPSLGQHTREVPAAVGAGDERIEQLRLDGVI